MPQWATSLAVALRLADGASGAWADRASDDAPGAAELQLWRALLLFPPLLPALVRRIAPDAPRALLAMEAWEVQPLSQPLTGDACGATLGALLRLYVARHAPLWKERPALWAWLLATAEGLTSRLAAADARVVAIASDCAAAREAEFMAGAHEHNEFGDADPSDFVVELPAQLPAEALAAAMADPGGVLLARPDAPRLPGRLVVPRAERLQLRPHTHPLLQFCLSLLPWAMPPTQPRVL